jgi:hypothetical protein
MMPLHSGVDQTACLSKADLTTLSGDTVNSQGPEAQVIFDKPKEAKYSP